MMTKRTTHLSSVTFALAIAAMGQGLYLRDHIIFYYPGPRTPAYAAPLEAFILTRLPEHDVLLTSVEGKLDIDPPAPSDRRAMVVADVADADSSEFRDFLSKLRRVTPGARLTLLGIPPANRPGKNLVPEYLPGEVFVDLEQVLSTVAGRARAINSTLAAAMLQNGPAEVEAGALLRAAAIFQAWHAPEVVSAVEIDALRGAVTRSENTAVRELENGRVIAWTEDDTALPLPLDFSDPAINLVIQSSDLVRQLDRETLRVRGMAEEQYTLTIDGQHIGVFHRDQLDSGINLALLRTPMWKQAMDVLSLTRRWDQLRARRRRLLETPREQRGSADWKATIERLEQDEAELSNEQRARARARTHDYELLPLIR